jgi:hypothetical protein
MYHTIQFTTDAVLDLEISRKQPLERLRVRRGTRLRAQIRPHVVEAEGGPVEVADLFFEDGTATRTVPWACLSFAE